MTRFGGTPWQTQERGMLAGIGAQEQQMGMAREQWDWAKRLFGQQAAAQKAAVPAMQKLVESFNVGTAGAKKSNLQRYQEMLGISRGETARQAGVQQRMLDLVGRTTGQREADIRGEGVSRDADVMQCLGRTGLAGTSGATTERAGVRRGTSEALNRLADQMQGTRLGVLGGMAQPRRGGELGIMERRTDRYPDPNLLMSLATGLGQSGGGGMASMINALSGMRLS